MSPRSGGLTGPGAATDAAAPDRRLRGRTYAIPFERVWSAALQLAGGAQRGWRVLSADDQAGVIQAEATSLVWRIVDDVHIDVGLDENAQTRVDLTAAPRSGRPDLGRNTRRVGRFLRRLDAALGATPGEILDPTLTAGWSGGS